MNISKNLSKLLSLLFLTGLLVSGCAAPATTAETAPTVAVVTDADTAAAVDASAPLFINMTTNDPHRANMALSFGMKQLDRGHPLTVFLNDLGVYVGTTANADQFAEQQKTIAALLEKGAKVFICPMCMEHYGVTKDTVLPGVVVSDPDAIGALLFQVNSRTLTW